jgi:predicted phosphodiesterase
MNFPPSPSIASRRAFLRNGSLILLGAGADWSGAANLLAEEQPPRPRIRVGLVTDLHHADKPPAGSRHYRETLAKLEEASERFEKDKPDMVVELGDLLDAADSVETELRYLRRIQRDFARLPGEKHYVLGNHCVDTLTKEEFLGEVGREKSYYSFDAGGVHFVVLDSCFRGDGVPYGRKNFVWTDPNIPPAELEWLRGDLENARSPAIVFAHQRLDVSNNHGVKNAADVRKTLESSGKVLAVFQGHSHRNDHHEINGIHYCTLVAMVEGSGEENNGYSLLDVFEGDMLRITGFRQQQDYAW